MSPLDPHNHENSTPPFPGDEAAERSSTTPVPLPARWDRSRFAEPPSLEDLEYRFAGISPRRRAFSSAITGGLSATAHWLERHWLGVVNGVLATYVGLAVATPIAFMFGLNGPASAVFRVYRYFCDELPTHSLFIGGYQICLCQRCLAIYTTMLVVGVALTFIRRRQALRGIPWWLWFLAMLPMVLDGGTQLFGWRESNLALRLLTGSLFGLATALFTLPQMDAAARPRTAPALAARRAGIRS
jgi:uncharacterized membrane protein